MAGAIQINSTEIISESGGTVTLKNVTTDSSADISASLSSLYATQSQVQGTHTTFNGAHSDGTTTINLGSVSGITEGDYVVGEGITPGTTVSSVGASSVVISAGLDTDTVGIGGGEPISFYTNSKTLSPGLVAGQLCRAWLNYNPVTPKINASYNVSSVTDATGNFVVNFTTAMPDANYSAQVTAGAGSGLFHERVNNLATGSFRIYTYRDNGSLTDYNPTCAAVFR